MPFSNTSSTIMVSELFGHLSFVLLAFSYTLSDLLPLRVLAVSSSTAMTFFAYFHPHGRILYLPFRWNCLFIVINVAQIVKILAEDMRAYMLDEGSKQLWRDHLQAMDLIDFAKLLTICSQVTYKKNEVMFEQGEKNDYMFLVIEGEIACQVDGVQTYSLNGGNFVAEAALHAGALIKDAVAVSATAVALEPTTVLKMHRRELIELLEKNPSLKKSLQNALTWDIVSKLKRQRHALVASDMVSERTRNWTEKRNKMTEERYIALLAALIESKSVVEGHVEAVVQRYRQIHIVSDAVHEEALAKCGWKVGDYNRGYKEGGERDGGGGGGMF